MLYRDFEPADLAPLLAKNQVAATVLVQAAATEEETQFLLELAREHAFIKGVVGWTDFDAPDVARRIAALVRAGAGKLKGLRPMIQDIADPDWVARPQLDAAFAAMIDRGLVFDALVKPQHLDALLARLQRQPQLGCVIDHAGKPEIAHRAFDSWARRLERLARETGAYCKLSGLLTEAAPGATAADLAPYVEHVFACFGPERVLWGSDWPVLDLASDYSAWLAMARELMVRFAEGRQCARPLCRVSACRCPRTACLSSRRARIVFRYGADRIFRESSSDVPYVANIKRSFLLTSWQHSRCSRADRPKEYS